MLEQAVVVEGIEIELLTVTAIPLSCIGDAAEPIGVGKSAATNTLTWVF